jgi:hypothetical protein
VGGNISWLHSNHSSQELDLDQCYSKGTAKAAMVLKAIVVKKFGVIVVNSVPIVTVAQQAPEFPLLQQCSATVIFVGMGEILIEHFTACCLHC